MLKKQINKIQHLLFTNKKSASKTILKNTFWLTSTEIIFRFLSFMLTIMIARHFGPEEYGKFAFAFSFVALFAVFADFGLSAYTIREISKDKNNAEKFANNAASIKLILSVIVFGLVILIIQLFNKSPEINLLVYIAGIFMILSSMTMLFSSIMRAFEKMEYEGLLKIIHSVLLFSLGGLAILYNKNITVIASVYAISAGAMLIMSIILIRKKFIKFSLSFDFKFWKKMLSQSWAFALISIFILIYYHIDKIMLSEMKSDQVVGWYDAAYKPVLFLIAIRSLFSGSIYPSLSRLYKGSINKMKEVVYNFEKFFIFLAFPLGIGTTILAPKIISLFYGDEYSNAAIALQVLIWSVVIIYINLLFPSILTACDKQKLYTLITMAGAIINISANFILIPEYGMVGAGIATILAELIVFILAYYYTKKLIVKVNIFKFFLKPFAASIIMGAFLIYLFNFNLFLLIFIGIITYIALIYVFRYFSPKEIFFIKNLLKIKQ